jgi:hypothetical protein
LHPQKAIQKTYSRIVKEACLNNMVDHRKHLVIKPSEKH